MKDNEVIKHEVSVLLEVLHKLDFTEIKNEDFKPEKVEHKKIVIAETEEDKKTKEKANTVLDSLYSKLVKLGLSEEELIYLGIESIEVRANKVKTNSSGNSFKKK